MYYNNAHKARDLRPLQIGEKVWIRDKKKEGVIENSGDQPRSYKINTGANTLKRNRTWLVPFRRDVWMNQSQHNQVPHVSQPVAPQTTLRRSSRTPKPTLRLDL